MPTSKIHKTGKLEVVSRIGLQRHKDKTGQNVVKSGPVSKKKVCE
jgi:hypothetical protein